MDKIKIIKGLRNDGKRITKVREQIINIILNATSPVTAPQIQAKLKKKNLSVNKTTVYRELNFLLEEKIISEVNLLPQVTHYESALIDHHHHLTCTECKKTKDIKTKELEMAMETLERRIINQGFALKKHTVEFYGLCANCQ